MLEEWQPRQRGKGWRIYLHSHSQESERGVALELERKVGALTSAVSNVQEQVGR